MNTWELVVLAACVAAIIAGGMILLINSRYWSSHSAHEKGLHRFWLNLGNEDGWNHWLESHLEVVTRSKHLGFRLHFGDRGSETPIDAMLGLWWISFFFGLRTNRLGQFCEWIGRGHKRNIALIFHHGQAWWELWYDDDDGYDQYHKCDKRRKPKLWPWSAGRTKYRSWMCLRKGNIDLNPLDALWGNRYYSYELLEEDTLLIEINQFPGDEYLVDFKLQKMTRSRRHGPKWARRVEFIGYNAEWMINEENEGIPTQNHDWKGDNTLGSAVKIEDHVYWRMEADTKLVAWVIKERKSRGYRPLTERMKHVSDQVDAMAFNFVALSEAAKNAGRSFEDLASMVATVDEKMDLVANERLKGMYTPEELAEQAVNRDKDSSE